MQFFVFIFMILIFSGCTFAEHSTANKAANDSNTSQSQTGVQLISISTPTAAQCPNGGSLFSIYFDLNNNQQQDADEETISSNVICNGTNGANGFSTAFNMNRVTIDVSTCASGTGVQLSSGLDLDRDLSLSATEIQQTSLLCDGQNGQQGAAGPAGQDGHSMQFEISPASTAVCPAGGSILVMALDVQNRGSYSSSDPNQQSLVICNGQQGAAATASAYSAAEVIMPCGNSVSYKEVLLRLANGQVLAAFSDNISGLNTRLSLIPDGTYMNSDGSQCVFSLSTQGQTRSISWGGTTQSSWPLLN